MTRRETLNVVFDGRCGMCTRAMAWIKSKDRHDRLTFHPYQGDGVLERFRLSEESARRAVWAISARGAASGSDSGGLSSISASYCGAAAMNRVLDTAFGCGFFSTLYRVPGVGWVQDRAYDWIAANRHRFRGITSWCDAHPGECGAEQSTDDTE